MGYAVLPISRPSTVPASRPSASGNGRDSYMSDGAPPATGTIFAKNTPRFPQAPVCARTDAVPKYAPSGSGRDLYMRSLDGGPIPATGKSTFSARPPVSPVAALHARTDAMPRYRHDGSGRDGYLVSATAATGGAFAARAPASPKKKGSLRTDMLPPFTPSGSGRDTFHRVEYRGAGAAWRLRDYCRADAMDDLFAASRGRNDARPVGGGLRSQRAAELSKRRQRAWQRRAFNFEDLTVTATERRVESNTFGRPSHRGRRGQRVVRDCWRALTAAQRTVARCVRRIRRLDHAARDAARRGARRGASQQGPRPPGCGTRWKSVPRGTDDSDDGFDGEARGDGAPHAGSFLRRPATSAG